MAEERRIVIELGCGPRKSVPGAWGVDRARFPTVDVVADLDAPLPFADGSVDEIHSSHLLEHLDDLAAVLADHHRVLRPGGHAVHVVPHFSNPYFYSDYTHRRFFGLYTLCYFTKGATPFRRRVPTFYNALDFEIVAVKLKFQSPFPVRKRIKRIVQRLVNRSRWLQELHEELLCWVFPAYAVSYHLRKRAPDDEPAA
jgi:SAM-dependent methyltransferase